MRIGYVGNFGPHNTETKIAGAAVALGHWVDRYDERCVVWEDLDPRDADVWFWTRTRRDGPAQDDFLTCAQGRKIPTAAIHLDLFHGIPEREALIGSVPFFRCAHVFTADGGNPDRWKDAGVTHHWMPPAADVDYHARRLRPRKRYTVGFFGTVNGYPITHPRRRDLVKQLNWHFGNRFVHYGRGGGPDLRGEALSYAMAECEVVAGDSHPTPHGRYWSDRVPETLGRSAKLAHTDVAGLRDAYPTANLGLWAPGDWTAMRETITKLRDVDAEPADVALGPNTWKHRVATILDTL